mmetsp:Transcript_92513/g.188282  ORF Transcript_92513/g.188282 Transcript_92513/m.188282 type:complete len:89 (+) Transcript_92513:895-1161(+)
MSTEGKLSLLIMVIPLAERDCEMPSDELSALSDEGSSEYGIMGRLKDSPNKSLDRIGCQGGREGSGMMEKMASMSSSDSTPSWSESNW